MKQTYIFGATQIFVISCLISQDFLGDVLELGLLACIAFLQVYFYVRYIKSEK